MPTYTLVLKKEKQHFYKRISIFIFIINALFLLYLSFFGEARNTRIVSGALLGLISLFTTINFYFRNTPYQYSYHVYFFAFTMSWINIGVWWMAAAMLVFDLLHHISTKEQKVSLSPEAVIIPSLFNKKENWTAFNNIILKDGLLTIDFANNKIVQQFVDEKSKLVNEEEFNDFCRQQLNR